MTKLTFEGFRAFVFQQDRDRAISHGGWESCAVGQYAYSEGREDAYEASMEIFEDPNALSYPLDECETPRDVVYQTLNYGANGESAGYVPVFTYGELQDLIVEQGL